MDVELRRHVADGGRVQLVDRPAQPLADATHDPAPPHRLLRQKRALFCGQVLQLDGALRAGDQDQPRKPSVVLQTHMAQRPVRDGDGTVDEGLSLIHI